MKKVMKLLPRLALILLVVPLLLVNLAMAYIMFAPDNLPKPFYLMYTVPSAAAASEETEGAETSEESSVFFPIPGQAPHAEEGKEETKPESEPKPPTAPLEIKPGQGIMIDTGAKIVNLVDPTGRKLLRAGITLEFAPSDLSYYVMEAEAKAHFLEEFNNEVNAKLPVINDIIITTLSSQTFESIYTAEGKEALRKTILSTINAQLPEYRVIFVYFTEFVVQ